MKNYLSKNLIKNENVVYQTNLHWSIYILVIIVGAIALISPIIGGVEGIALTAILSPVVAIGFLLAWLKRRFFGFAVTNRRLIAKTEFLNTVDLPLKQIESVTVDQGFFGAILDFGSVVICGSGGTKTILKGVNDPDKFKIAVMEQIS